jgi:hypothetical protein
MDPKRLRSLRITAMFLWGALVVQYALGMYVNLFVSFPANATEGQLWEFAWAQPSLAAHIILAILILLAAITLCVRGIRSKNRQWIITSSIGLAAVLAAGASGATFIPTQTDLYSYSMSLAFLIAIFAYAWALFSSRLNPSTSVLS